MSDKGADPSVISPRKKLATPVKVHLTHAKNTGEPQEEKRNDGQEEKTAVQPSSAGSAPLSKSKRTPVRLAIQSAVGLANHGRFLEAIRELDRAMELYPELKSNVRLHMNRGTYHFRAGQLEESLTDFDRAAAIDDGLASLHFNRGNVFKGLGRFDDALKSYMRATEIDPKLADAHAGVAHMLMREKKFRQALASASRALEINPKNFSALDAKMKCLARLGRTLEAVDSVKALIACYQQMAKAPVGTIDAVPEQHRKAFSRILVHAATKIQPSDPAGLELAREAFVLDLSYDACFELANQLFARSMHEEAATAFKRSGELEPTRSEPPLLEGVCWIQLGKYEKALTSLRRASKLRDNQKEVRFYIGLSLLNLGRYSEAIPPLRRVLESSSQNDDEIIEKGRCLLATAYVHAGEEERAFQLLQIARRAPRGSQDPEVHFLAGYAASLLGRDEDAKECLERCLVIDPKHQRAKDTLRNIADKQKVLTIGRPPSPPPLPPPPVTIDDEDRGRPNPNPPNGPPPTPPGATSPTKNHQGRKTTSPSKLTQERKISSPKQTTKSLFSTKGEIAREPNVLPSTMAVKVDPATGEKKTLASPTKSIASSARENTKALSPEDNLNKVIESPHASQSTPKPSLDGLSSIGSEKTVAQFEPTHLKITQENAPKVETSPISSQIGSQTYETQTNGQIGTKSGSSPVSPRGSNLTSGKGGSYQKLSHLGIVSGAAAARQAKAGLSSIGGFGSGVSSVKSASVDSTVKSATGAPTVGASAKVDTGMTKNTEIAISSGARDQVVNSPLKGKATLNEVTPAIQTNDRRPVADPRPMIPRNRPLLRASSDGLVSGARPLPTRSSDDTMVGARQTSFVGARLKDSPNGRVMGQANSATISSGKHRDDGTAPESQSSNTSPVARPILSRSASEVPRPILARAASDGVVAGIKKNETFKEEAVSVSEASSVRSSPATSRVQEAIKKLTKDGQTNQVYIATSPPKERTHQQRSIIASGVQHQTAKQELSEGKPNDLPNSPVRSMPSCEVAPSNEVKQPSAPPNAVNRVPSPIALHPVTDHVASSKTIVDKVNVDKVNSTSPQKTRPALPARPASLRAMPTRFDSDSASLAKGTQNALGSRHAMRPKSKSAEVLLTPSKLSPDVQNMINELFGPPEGTEDDVKVVSGVFEDEGIERMADVALLSLQDLESLPGLKRGWCRRILNYVSKYKAADELTAAATDDRPREGLNLTRPSNEQEVGDALHQKPRVSLIAGIEKFDASMLRKIETVSPSSLRPPKEQPQGIDEVLVGIKNFQKSNLRPTESVPKERSVAQIPMDASGILGTLVNAMRSRRVLLDDIDFEGGRKAAVSDVDNDDMFEAEWI